MLKELATHAASVTGQHKSQLLCKWRQLISVSLECAVSCRELRYMQLMRTRQRDQPVGARLQTVRPIEQMWDLITDHGGAATAAPDIGAAHNPGPDWRGGGRARTARQRR